ncbi:hypothetical protein Y032_0453g1720 [Ancylostoma ceylanicum]|uniref:Uncharacterized protein n=1 Tax=Ancylostoma ceylanicum TaxID=53326 RepID=A0A016WY05_9BILA|nr:hypothetical protein Y032_0453g1720 [Ancylostoma ceylanicum]
MIQRSIFLFRLIVLAIIIGGVGFIILIAILIPVILKLRRYRHKKWLEETWEERVRKAAADLNVQGGTGTAPSKNSRAGRKALKQTTLKSKEGSKEIGSKEIGSKEGSRDFGSRDKMSNEGDELFPAAVGPNDPRGGAGYGGYSNEGPNRGGAGYGGYSNEGPNRGGAGYGGGYSNEGANRGGAGYGGYPNAGANMPNANAPNMW